MINTSAPKDQNKVEKAASSLKKTVMSSFRGFVSIDQEMGREIAMMFFNPSKDNSFAASGYLAGKVKLSS